MKKICMILSITIILGFLAHAEAGLINLDNYITYSSCSYTTELQQLMNINFTSAVTVSYGEISLLKAEMKKFTSIDLRDTIVMNLRDTDRGSFGWLRSNHDIPAPVPEPATMIFLGTGLLGIAGYIRILGRE